MAATTVQMHVRIRRGWLLRMAVRSHCELLIRGALRVVTGEYRVGGSQRWQRIPGQFRIQEVNRD